MALRRDLRLLAAGCWDSTVRLFDCKSLKPLAVLKHHFKSVRAVAFSPAHLLLTASEDKRLSLWKPYQ